MQTSPLKSRGTHDDELAHYHHHHHHLDNHETELGNHLIYKRTSEQVYKQIAYLRPKSFLQLAKTKRGLNGLYFARICKLEFRSQANLLVAVGAV